MVEGNQDRGVEDVAAADSGLVARVLSRFAVAAAAELDAAILWSLEEIARETDIEHAFVFLRDPGGESFSLPYEWCAPHVRRQHDLLQRVPNASFPWLTGGVLAGKSIQIDDMPLCRELSMEERAVFGPLGTRSMLILPLRGRGRSVTGAIGLSTSRRAHRWTPEDVSQARVIGDVLASVIERKQMEQEVREREAQLLALTELMPDIISIIDSSGNLIFNSPACKRIHGYEVEEMLGSNTADRWHPDDAAAAQHAFARLLAAPGAIEKVQYRYRNKDGSYVWMEAVACSQLHHPVIQGIVCLSRDISDRKREEEERRRLDLEVQRLQNMETLRVLAGGVAHDFNNLLVAIIGNIELAMADLPADSRARRGLIQANTASHRAADLAKQMLVYAGNGRPLLQSVDLGELVEEMANMLEAAVSRRASLRVRREKPLPRVDVDASQIRQVVLNLILNAAEAIGAGGGTITVATSEQRCTREWLAGGWLDEQLPEGRYVLLEVSDTGAGMEKETLARVFDPFFTTKFTGRGLGLAAALGIVRSHKGSIRVRSEPGHGTTFSVLLPVGASASVRPPSPPDSGRAISELSTVLLVDDDDDVREVARLMIERLGFQVAEASGGAQAIELLLQDQARCGIRLVILDLTMPEMNGREVFSRLRALREELPVVIASGYAESEVMRGFETGTGVTFLQKPFTIGTLDAALGHALARGKKP